MLILDTIQAGQAINIILHENPSIYASSKRTKLLKKISQDFKKYSHRISSWWKIRVERFIIHANK